MASLVGQIVSRYRIPEHFGRGGMGVVYRARNLTADRPVARTFLSTGLTSGGDGSVRFLHEVKEVSSLDYRNVWCVSEICESEDWSVFVGWDSKAR